ncbi:hypothetical protein L9F63_000211, partial [Diploptera punctata]
FDGEPNLRPHASTSILKYIFIIAIIVEHILLALLILFMPCASIKQSLNYRILKQGWRHLIQCLLISTSYMNTVYIIMEHRRVMGRAPKSLKRGKKGRNVLHIWK